MTGMPHGGPTIASAWDAQAQLTPLEIATGLVYGMHDHMDPLPAPHPRGPRHALELAVLPHLQHGTCVVSFSGGRDSSAVLAVAAAVARQQGLASPVPVTLRFPGVADAAERQWQEMVVRHLGVTDWQTIDITDELDLVGPRAAAALRRHGLVWPCNAHFHDPIFPHAASGTVLTGTGGDELFSPYRWRRIALLLQGALRPRIKDLLRVALGGAPARLSRPVHRYLQRRTPRPAWLRPAARRRFAWCMAGEAAAEPIRYDTMIRRLWWPSRYRVLIDRTLSTLAADYGATVAHPFGDARFLASLAADGGAAGYRTRVDVMRRLFDDLLPAELLERSSKARFNDAFWNIHSRAFVERWDGGGIDPTVVDADLLRRMWRRDGATLVTSWTLFQAAWLQAQDEAAATAASIRSTADGRVSHRC